MHLFSRRDIQGDLEDLLDRERAAILSCNFDGLTRLVPEKERLVQDLTSLPSPKRLAKLRGKLDRNKDLLQAAGRGINSAASQLSHAAAKHDQLQTYDSRGQRNNQMTDPGKIERRA